MKIRSRYFRKLKMRKKTKWKYDLVDEGYPVMLTFIVDSQGLNLNQLQAAKHYTLIKSIYTSVADKALV